MAETFIPGALQDFELPETLIVRVGLKADGGFGISPGHLTESQACEYWDNMRESWLEHCKRLRDRIGADGALDSSRQKLPHG